MVNGLVPRLYDLEQKFGHYNMRILHNNIYIHIVIKVHQIELCLHEYYINLTLDLVRHELLKTHYNV